MQHLFSCLRSEDVAACIPCFLLELVDLWWPQANNECIYNVKTLCVTTIKKSIDYRSHVYWCYVI